MFTLDQIYEAHRRVKSGADFPQYARDLVALGVTSYATFVAEGNTVYFGNPEPLIAPGKYQALTIALVTRKEYFIERLQLHQSGGTDYMTFCQDCADAGVEQWVLDLRKHTCTYQDANGMILLVEHFPE